MITGVSKPISPRFIERLFDPEYSLLIFSLALGVVYGIVPLTLYMSTPANETFLQLALITFGAIVAMYLGSKFPYFDHRFELQASRLLISGRFFIAATWVVFVLFIVLTAATAPSIPLISALQGASSLDLSQARGEFLKGRQGAEVALLYLSTFLVNTVVPYSIILLYVTRSRLRHVAAILFFLFCISFLQKALFLNLILPLLAYLAITRQLRAKRYLILIVGPVLLLIASTFVTLTGEAWDARESEMSDYFSASYAPSNPLDYFFWRSVAVPIFTATDTLVVHSEQFHGEPLTGATSSFLAMIFGVERVNIERYVFEYQFGGWNEIANANAVFVIDAYINFGWMGVVLFGFIVGLAFRWFRISNDVAFKSLWAIFAFVLFSAPLIGMLLSNGFAYMLMHALYIRVGDYGKHRI